MERTFPLVPGTYDLYSVDNILDIITDSIV